MAKFGVDCRRGLLGTASFSLRGIRRCRDVVAGGWLLGLVVRAKCRCDHLWGGSKQTPLIARLISDAVGRRRTVLVL